MYEDIRKIDPVKFVDLEATMRMLYDHGNMTFEGPPQSISNILPTNASMREPKRAAAVSRAVAPPASDKVPAALKRKRQESQTLKAGAKPIKVAK